MKKKQLELITNRPITANRVHYLNSDMELAFKLQYLGFTYDSSAKKVKDRITKDDMGYYKIGNLIEFPYYTDGCIPIYLHENQRIPNSYSIRENLGFMQKSEKDILTVIWHDNVLKMIGGRMYSSILQYLTSRHDIQICRGIDLAKMINQT